jgi:hypothetical protein
MPVRRRLTPAEIDHVRALAEILESEADVDAALLTDLADVFARAAMDLESPAKSFAKRVPYYLQEVLSEGKLAAVIRAANERVARLRAERAADALPRLARFLTIDEVAPLLNLTVSVMEKLLMDPEFRRACGWPHWIAGRWHFHADAFGPRKPEYFSRLPDREPFPPPTHCQLQPPEASCA